MIRDLKTCETLQEKISSSSVGPRVLAQLLNIFNHDPGSIRGEAILEAKPMIPTKSLGTETTL